jgi:peptidyl-prolyl cis-trans isomerase SurA
MKLRVWAKAFFCIFGMTLAGTGSGAHAQIQPTQSADFIVAVVNSEPITNSEVRAQVLRFAQQLAQAGQPAILASELRSQVLERLINDRAQVQVAVETGVRVDESAVDLAEQSVAQQNRTDVAGLHRQLTKDGNSLVRFRAQLRDQLLLTRLHEREVQSRIKVTDVDVDRALQELLKSSSADPMAQEINLAHLLVALPEKASAEKVASIFGQAQKILIRIRNGEDFGQLVQTLSAADRTQGGQMGLRRAYRYPPSFVAATQALPQGGVSEIVRSDAGFHILKVIQRVAPTTVVRTVVQTHARHILLRPTPQVSQKVVQAKLEEIRKRILSGKATFAAMAREYSQDGSAPQGGDLGWANPGMFVPEFEEVMGSLNEGQISGPVVSRFGVHLMEVVERRRIELNPLEIRELVRNQLRESRYEEAYANWASEVRGRAFVELREPPQ